MQTKNENQEIKNLINRLDDKDIQIREQARALLINKREESVVYLLELLQSENANHRLEAVMLLGRIGDQTAATALVEALNDESMGVHWAASDALIELDGGAILPLLEGLTKHFDSERFRQGAYHVLHTFEQSGYIDPHVREVLEALRGVEPFASVPWAAERAIEAIAIR